MAHLRLQSASQSQSSPPSQSAPSPSATHGRFAPAHSRAEALERCGADWSIQGGEPVMGQWLQASRDHNVTCPGVSRDLGRWFAATRG